MIMILTTKQLGAVNPTQKQNDQENEYIVKDRLLLVIIFHSSRQRLCYLPIPTPDARRHMTTTNANARTPT
jgi:hypothetical protein